MTQSANTLTFGEGTHACGAYNSVVCVRPRRRSDSRQKYDFSWSTGGAFEEEYEEAAPQKKELFYTEGPASLKQARLQFANFSLDRAARRLAGAKRKRDSPDEDEEAEKADTVSLMKKVCACLVFLPA